jgi:hypothetical protein
MALESATFINQLNSANPSEGDPIINAADHMRLIKACLQATFPNFTGVAVSSTESQLSLGVVPTGGVIMWTGSTAPAGWGLCNGTTYTKSSGSGTITAPNLQDQFIVGAGDYFAVGAVGGSFNHAHTFTDNGVALSIGQIPNFSISISDPGHNHGVNDPGHSHNINEGTISVSGGSSATQVVVRGYGSGNPGSTNGAGTGIWLNGSATGITAWPNGPGNQAHSHSGTTGNTSTLPPYYALAFIMKL